MIGKKINQKMCKNLDKKIILKILIYKMWTKAPSQIRTHYLWTRTRYFNQWAMTIYIQPNWLSVLNVHVLVYMWCTLIDRHYLFNAIKITEDTCIYRSGLYRGSLKRGSNGLFLMYTLQLLLFCFCFFAMESLLQNFAKIASFRKI